MSDASHVSPDESYASFVSLGRPYTNDYGGLGDILMKL